MRNVRLNQNAIKDLEISPASGSKKIIWDLAVRCFGVYKTSVGRICFLYQYKDKDGRTRSRKIGELGVMTFDAARKVAAVWANERYQGIDPIAKRAKSDDDRKAAEALIIANYFTNYVERRSLSSKPLERKQIRVFERDLVEPLGKISLGYLTPEIVDNFAEALKERGPSIVRSGLVCLKTIIGDAVKRGSIQRQAAHDFEVPKTNKRKRRLSVTEFQRVFEACRDIQDVRADALEMILRTSKRKEEVAGLPWDEVDLDTRQWKLPAERNKSARNELIILPTQVVDLLKRVQPDAAKRVGFVFTLNGRTSVEMTSQVKDLVDSNLHRRLELAAGPDSEVPKFAQWTIHDSRKTPASILREAPFRYPPDLVNRMMLHRIGDDLDETYMLTELVEETGEMLQTWNDHMDELLSQSSMWPGGRKLPRMKPSEQTRRLSLLRKGWPLRTDQKRAAAVRAAEGVCKGSTGTAAMYKRRQRMRDKAKIDGRSRIGDQDERPFRALQGISSRDRSGAT